MAKNDLFFNRSLAETAASDKWKLQQEKKNKKIMTETCLSSCLPTNMRFPFVLILVLCAFLFTFWVVMCSDSTLYFLSLFHFHFPLHVRSTPVPYLLCVFRQVPHSFRDFVFLWLPMIIGLCLLLKALMLNCVLC